MKKQQSFAKIPRSISPERVFFFEVARIAPVIACAALYWIDSHFLWKEAL